MSENLTDTHDTNSPSHTLLFSIFHRLQMKLVLRLSFGLPAYWEVQPSPCPQPGKEALRRGDWTWVLHQIARQCSKTKHVFLPLRCLNLVSTRWYLV